ncbi:glyoxalase [Sedimentitalea sp. CY04]|uniref:Glyoxalase n=1 Tax=Parasedimentitalea denitrificans TaxID=2211118 RepID=A0ABX0W3N7_9RHOB|nr:VOC family protein [Sedimentitalea sp. CY04]NIZ60051.1 glyoxalase [Sedimentitalea sp. CY04]
MEQRVSLITLGVEDMQKAAAFYEALGWKRVESQEGIIVFNLISQTLGLYPLQALADEVGLPVEELGKGGVSLSYNTRTKDEVAEVLAAAEAAGAEVLVSATDVFWGGHHGYFRAPDGQLWEVAFNPFSALSGEGAFRWGGY